MWSIIKSEEEYVNQLDVLVNQFQHPCEIATTSRHPPLTLEACKKIFRNWLVFYYISSGWFLTGSLNAMEKIISTGQSLIVHLC